MATTAAERMPTKTRPGPGWRMQTEALEIMGIPISTWDSSIRGLLDPSATQPANPGTWVHIPSVIRFLRDRERERGRNEKRAATPAGSDVETPLQRKQAIEAELKKLELRKQVGELVEVSELMPLLMGFANRLSGYAESVGRKSSVAGADVQRGINEIVDDSLRTLDQEATD